MTNQVTHTAILLFSRSSEQEAQAKTFFASKFHKRNKHIVQGLIDRSVHQIKATGLPYYVWDEQLQSGSSFGEKLALAIEAIFQKGFQKIVVVGNDCLALTSEQMQRAAILLNANDAVLVPTKKGGLSLIGLSKENFDKKSFIEVRWQTSFTSQDLWESMIGQQIYSLPLTDDINSYADLRQQVDLLLKDNPFRIFIENLLTFTHSRLSPVLSDSHRSHPKYFFGVSAPPLPRY